MTLAAGQQTGNTTRDLILGAEMMTGNHGIHGRALDCRKTAERQDGSVVMFLLQLSGGEAQPGLALQVTSSALTSDFPTWQTIGPHGVETR